MKPISLGKIKLDWFLLGQSKEFKKGAIKAYQLFDIPIVVFRQTDNQLGALVDRCPHRNVPLSRGKLINNDLVCPYHGWQFNKTGLCTAMPGCIERKLKEVRVQALAIKEEDGYIWVSLNAENEAPLPVIPYLNDKTYHTFSHEFSTECSFVNLLENFLDPMHTHFVHAGLIRKDSTRQKVKVSLHLQKNSVEALYQGETKANGFIAKWFEKSRSKSYGRFMLPTTGQLEYRSEKKLNMLITAFILPASEKQLKITVFFTMPKGILPLWLKRAFIWPFLSTALFQDLKILKQQKDNIAKFQGQECFQYTPLDLMRPQINKLLTYKTTDISPLRFEREIEI